MKVLAAIAAAILAAGCGGKSEGEAAAKTGAEGAAGEKTPEQAPEAKGENEKLPRKLRAKTADLIVLRTALTELGVADETKKKIRALLPHGSRQSPKERREKNLRMREQLALSVEKGVADEGIYADAMGRSRARSEERRELGLDAINRLHDLLDEKQRGKLAAMIGARVKEHRAAVEKQETRLKKRRGKRGRTIELKPKRKSSGLRLARLAMRLDITPQQREKIEAIQKESIEVIEEVTPDPDESRERAITAATEIAERFAEPDFDATALDVFGPSPEQRNEKIVEARTSQVQKLLDVLTEQQRKDLAEKIRTGRNRGAMPQGPGKGRRGGARQGAGTPEANSSRR